NYGPDRLYRNDGGRFTDITAESGIAVDGFSVGAAWGDANLDGHLDLLVCGYVVWDPAVRPGSATDPFPGPGAYRGEPTRLLLGSADGKFTDVTRDAGMWTRSGRGMGVAFADLSGDARPELVVANDSKANHVWEVGEDGVYVEAGFLLGAALSDIGQERSSMGVTVVDVDRDGLQDMVIPDGTGGCLYRNLGGRFEDRARRSGMEGAMRGRVGWSATPLDYDLDGFPDVLVTCGGMHARSPQQPVLFRNEGHGLFFDATTRTNLPGPMLGRGSVAADLDGDGDPDLVVACLGARPRLLRNDGGEKRKSLSVRCRGAGRNGDALGAVIEVTVGDLVQVEQVRTTQGYLAGSGPELLFGLGDAAKADRVRVVFPGGAVRVLKDVPAGRVVIDERKDGDK
ncbi:MAG: CRTAC1 family protein, partial [Planctomycetota bacterium]